MTSGRFPGTLGIKSKSGRVELPGSLGVVAPTCTQVTLPTALGTLDCFPVTYARNFTPRGPVRQENPREFQIYGTSDSNSITIWFSNNFDRPRPHHGAIDIFGPIGSPVLLTSNQTVVKWWMYRGRSICGVTRTDVPPGSDKYSADGGNTVRTIDSRGFVHYYSHLQSPPDVVPGRSYQAGQVIGYLGDTGNARGDAHLHYAVKTPLELRGHLDDRYGMPTPPGLCLGFPFYDALGNDSVNPFDELLRLARRLTPPARQGQVGIRYYLPLTQPCPI